MRFNKWLWFLCMMMVLPLWAAQPAWGSSPSLPPGCQGTSNTSLKCLDALRAEISILREQLSIAKLRNAIKNAVNGQSGPAAILGSTQQLPQMIPPGALTTGPAPVATALPSVSSISGSGKTMTATLGYRDGGTQNVRVGEALPGGWRVAAIGPDGVVVVRGHERTTLGMGAGALQTNLSGNTQSQTMPAPIITTMPIGTQQAPANGGG